MGKPKGQIMMFRIIRMIDGPLAPLPCVRQTAYRKSAACRDEMTNGIRRVMKELRDLTAKIWDGISLAQIVKNLESQKRIIETKTA